MDDRMSVCITQKNRTPLLRDKLIELREMDYDPKKLEICITDGGSTDGLIEMLQEFVPDFLQIKYAFSDRLALPFVIPENNPACDINAQICHVASFSKIVRTDAEVRFRHRGSLQLINNNLNNNPDLCICFRSWHMPEDYKPGDDQKDKCFSAAKMSFHCSCFWKEAFIKNRGVEEDFARGFAAEDSYFHQWWRKNRRMIHPPVGYEVLHLWHGRWQSENRLRLKHDYSLPLYKRYLKENHIPNKDNPNWMRPEMIKDVQVWKS